MSKKKVQGNSMTQEARELLFRDLSARVPFCVRVQVTNTTGESCDEELNYSKLDRWLWDNPPHNLFYEGIRPYLRPMSSMTEEEKSQYSFFLTRINTGYDASKLFDWLNKNKFDYRELIPKGLALEAPEGMYK